MTPEAQRIAIAEACGWKYHGEATYGGTHRNGWWKDDSYSFHGIPDYLNDLNAMHEAEKEIKAKRVFSAYLSELALVCGFQPHGDEAWHKLHAGLESVASATAAQRAEAFLRTLNLWNPTP
jgi:hypothetical protein